MVKIGSCTLAKGPTLIYGVKRGKIPMALRPVPPQEGRWRSRGRSSCLEEIAALHNCWKTTDFEDRRCSKEIEDFFTCAGVAIEKRKELLKEKPENQYKAITKLLRRHTADKRGKDERFF